MSKLSLRLHADEEHWIPLSDLMTGLMFLFLVISLAYMVAAAQRQSKPINILKGYSDSRAQMYSDLRSSLGPGLQRLHASIDPATLSVRFSGNTGLFAAGSAQITPQFQSALNQFFPQYVAILRRYRPDISEIRIEGYTSKRWPAQGAAAARYSDDLALSQERARNVLDYVMAFNSVKGDLPWLAQIVSADGFSYSHPVLKNDGEEDASGSDRVEFHVVGDANTKIAAAMQASASAIVGVKATPAPMPPPTIAAPLPAYPAWSKPLIGKALTASFPHTAVRCYGNLDSVLAEYSGRPSGAQVSGWAFDLNAWAPVQRVVVADAHGTIVGAADGGYERSDVQNSIAWITSPNTGWRGSVAATQGVVTPWAVMPPRGTVCRLNVAPNLSHEPM